MKLKVILFFFSILFLGTPFNSSAQTLLRDMVKVQHANERTLIGYGLVTGLDRTGDRTIRRQGAVFTIQSIANMLQNFGIQVDPDFMRTRNVAAVMVTATLSPYHGEGSYVDVTVSSLGDATSLVGGVLLQTPLIDPEDKDYYVKAQGPLIVGGMTAEIPGARVTQNQTLTGRVPNGGTVVQNQPFEFSNSEPLGLILMSPSYVNAERIADAVNANFNQPIADIVHAGLVHIEWPPQIFEPSDMNRFVSQVLQLDITVDMPARVVINERTGTIVAGGRVRIDEVLVSHGNINIQTQVTPFVSQPAPLSLQGQTVVGNAAQAGISEGPSRTFVLEPNATVSELAAALNQLGLSSRDIIAIFQAIKSAGALKGQLVII